MPKATPKVEITTFLQFIWIFRLNQFFALLDDPFKMVLAFSFGSMKELSYLCRRKYCNDDKGYNKR